MAEIGNHILVVMSKVKYKAESKHLEQICGSKVDEIGVGTAQKGVSPLLGEHLSKHVLAQVNSS